MKIHVSSETKQVLDKFNTFDLERRSPDIEVKVGHLIKCYQTFYSFPLKVRVFFQDSCRKVHTSIEKVRVGMIFMLLRSKKL